MRGSEFVQAIKNLPMGRERMEAVYQAVLAGWHLRQPLSRVLIGTRGYFEATDDYFSIGTPEDFVRVPLDAPTTQRIFNHLGLLVPTVKMVRMIHAAAGVKLAPQSMGPPKYPWDDSMTTVERFEIHNGWIEKQRAGRTGLCSGSKKDVVITNRTLAQPGRLPIFGWIKSDGKEVQPLSLFHEDEYTDYAEGTRGIYPVMRLDGEDRAVEEILIEPELAALLSHEGAMKLATTRLSLTYAPRRVDDDPTPPADPAPQTVSKRPTLRLGSPQSVAEHILVWQELVGVTEDGFGILTEAATKMWQREHGLEDDGVVGPRTWGKSGIIGPTIVKAPTTAVVASVTRTGGDLPGVQFIEAKYYQKTTGRRIDGVCLHTGELPEKPTSAEGLGAYFKNPPVKASAHFCLDPRTRVLTEDLHWVPVGDIDVKHRLVATEEHAPDMGGRTLQVTNVLRAHRRVTECVSVDMEDGREIICSTDHKWLTKHPNGELGWCWRSSSDIGQGYRISAPLRPWDQRNDREAGYMEGIFDGEGSWGSNRDVTFSQKHGYVLNRAKRILDLSGIKYRTHVSRESGVVNVSSSGIQSTLQSLGQFRPHRLGVERRWIGRSLKSRTHSHALRVMEVRSVGRLEVMSIETDLRTFIAEGLVSHNCVDNNSIVQSVLERDVAYTAPGSNHNMIQIEHAGYAKQTASEWADEYSTAMLEQSAKLVAGICLRYDIPIGFIDRKGLLAGKCGITTHHEVSQAFKRSDHYDPGPNFPMGRYLELVRQFYEDAAG